MEKTTINWYPGHMAKSTKEIQEIASVSDLIIHVIDSRAPFKTFNESMIELFKNKEMLFILSKSDLRDASKDNEVIEKLKQTNYMFANLKNHNEKKKVLQRIKALTQEKINRMKSKGLISYKVKIFVVGLPNVGKSTLINLLIGKRKLKAENYPGVTKKINWVNVDNIYLLDTPGIMPMRIESDDDGFLLVFLQIIKQSIVNQDLLFKHTISIIQKEYPNLLNSFLQNESTNFNEIYLNLLKYIEIHKITEKQAIERIINSLREKQMTFL